MSTTDTNPDRILDQGSFNDFNELLGREQKERFAVYEVEVKCPRCSREYNELLNFGLWECATHGYIDYTGVCTACGRSPLDRGCLACDHGPHPYRATLDVDDQVCQALSLLQNTAAEFVYGSDEMQKRWERTPRGRRIARYRSECHLYRD